VGSDGTMRLQSEVDGSKIQIEPFSSSGAMAMPPRPEKTNIFWWSVVDAAPTRGGGERGVEARMVTALSWGVSA